jgi:hypothetical protein
MKIRSLVVAALICVSVPAAADFIDIVKAHEVELANLRLPGTSGGTLSFKPCDACPYQTVRVTAETSYEANGRSFTLEEFRRELEAVDPNDEWLTLMHHLESNTITAVRADF